MCGHFLDQADGRRTAKDARRDAASERRVDIEIAIAQFLARRQPPAASGSAGDLRSAFLLRTGAGQCRL